MKTEFAAAAMLLGACALSTGAQADCAAFQVVIPGYIADLEGTMTVKAGTGCRFNVNGIEGGITEVAITQQPKHGRAGVQNLYPFYLAKPGYSGPDEFAYAIIGTDRYGGPMKVVIRRKVTVTP
jgi:hypothetical protein